MKHFFNLLKFLESLIEKKNIHVQKNSIYLKRVSYVAASLLNEIIKILLTPTLNRSAFCFTHL